MVPGTITVTGTGGRYCYGCGYTEYNCYCTTRSTILRVRGTATVVWSSWPSNEDIEIDAWIFLIEDNWFVHSQPLQVVSNDVIPLNQLRLRPPVRAPPFTLSTPGPDHMPRTPAHITNRSGDPEPPVEVIAQAVLSASAAIEQLRTGKLNDRALLILIAEAAPKINGRTIPLKQIKAVLDGMANLRQAFIRED